MATAKELEAQIAQLIEDIQKKDARIVDLEAELEAAKKGGSRKIMGQAVEWLRERDVRGGKLSATQAMVVCVLAKAGKPITPKGITLRLKNRVVTPKTGLDAKLRPAYQALQLMGLIEFARNGKPGLHYQVTEWGKAIMTPILADMTSEDPGVCFFNSEAIIEGQWFTAEQIEAGDEIPAAAQTEEETE